MCNYDSSEFQYHFWYVYYTGISFTELMWNVLHDLYQITEKATMLNDINNQLMIRVLHKNNFKI